MIIQITPTDDHFQEITQDLSVFSLPSENITINLKYDLYVNSWFVQYKKYINNTLIHATNQKILQPNISCIPHLSNVYKCGIMFTTRDGLKPFSDQAFTNGNAFGDGYGILLYSLDEQDALFTIVSDNLKQRGFL